MKFSQDMHGTKWCKKLFADIFFTWHKQTEHFFQVIVEHHSQYTQKHTIFNFMHILEI